MAYGIYRLDILASGYTATNTRPLSTLYDALLQQERCLIAGSGKSKRVKKRSQNYQKVSIISRVTFLDAASVARTELSEAGCRRLGCLIGVGGGVSRLAYAPRTKNGWARTCIKKSCKGALKAAIPWTRVILDTPLLTLRYYPPVFIGPRIALRQYTLYSPENGVAHFLDTKVLREGQRRGEETYYTRSPTKSDADWSWLCALYMVLGARDTAR